MAAEARFEPWPWAMGGLLAAMIGACLVFWTVAVRYPDPEVVEDAYLAGLGVNAELRAERRARELGLELSLEAQPAPGGMAVEVAVLRPAGSDLPVDSVVVRRERPAEGDLDADFVLPRRADAIDGEADSFAGVIPLPRPGRWRLVATATLGDERVRQVFEAFHAPGVAAAGASE